MVKAVMWVIRNRKQLLNILIILICILNLNIFISHHFKDAKIQSGTNQRKNVGTYYKFHDRVQVRLWIDLPTVFPWRNCLELYNRAVHTVGCGGENGRRQLFTVEPLPGDGARFQLLGADGGEEACVRVDSDKLGYVVRRNGSQHCPSQLEGYWKWSNQTGISISADILTCSQGIC